MILKAEMSGSTRIYKILTGPEWDAFNSIGQTHGSQDDIGDGFIHLSAAEQLQGTLQKHFAIHERVWLLELDGQNLTPMLRWEPSRSGALYPHLYGVLELRHIAASFQLTRAPDGAWRSPPEIA
jgi:uncharacterized protein (DUF952 family)